MDHETRLEMKTIEFSQQEFLTAMAFLGSYYGLDESSLPETINAWIGTGHKDDGKICLSIKDCLDEFDIALYNLELQETSLIRKTLLLLSYIMRNSPQIQGMVSKSLFDSLQVKEIDKLKSFLRSISPGESITLKGRCGSISLRNYSDWLRKDLIQPYIERRMNEDGIDSSCHGSIYDPRIPLILGGTYRFLSKKGMRPEFNDQFCDLVLSMLKLQEIIPDTTEKDKSWLHEQWRKMDSGPRLS